MPIRSMTGYAQVRANAGEHGFTLSLKAVNHRYLDLHFRLPAESESLEIKLRQFLKEKLARGHVDVVVSLNEGGAALSINREFVGGYVKAFRAASQEFGLTGEPDLNMALRLPGALAGGAASANGNFESEVLAAAAEAAQKLDAMRQHEGESIGRELRERVQKLAH